MFRKSSGQGSNITIIGSGSRFSGTLELEGDVHIDGQCEGTIVAHAKLSIGPAGSVRGELSGNVVVVAGRVEGTTVAKDALHVLNTGSLQGDVFYGQLQVDSGGVIDARTHKGPPPTLTAPTAEVEEVPRLPERVERDGTDGDNHDKASSAFPRAAGVARSVAPGRR